MKKAIRRRGRPSIFDGKTLNKVKNTTRKDDSIGHRCWMLIFKGMTYEQYKEAGGTRRHLAWEIDKGHIEIS